LFISQIGADTKLPKWKGVGVGMYGEVDAYFAKVPGTYTVREEKL